jgi:AcrR family transcriptional regulator
MAKKVLKNELDFFLFSEIYQRFQEPRAKRKALNLLESTIQCLSRKGFDGITLEMIARESAVTRPLIKHYFDDLQELKVFSIKYIRLLFQTLAVDEMKKAKNPAEMLGAYIDSCFRWVSNHRSHSLVWLAFMHRCAHNSEMRQLNTEAVDTGNERIETLLELGKSQSVFHFDLANETAKMIQVLITGALITFVSENLKDPKAFAIETRNTCLQLAGFRSQD